MRQIKKSIGLGYKTQRTSTLFLVLKHLESKTEIESSFILFCFSLFFLGGGYVFINCYIMGYKDAATSMFFNIHDRCVLYDTF